MALALVMGKYTLALPLSRSASLSAHLQELDGLEVSKLMGSDSIKGRAEPFKIHSPSC